MINSGHEHTVHIYVQRQGKLIYNFSSVELKYTVLKDISSDWQSQKVPLSLTDKFVIDHKEKMSLINHKIVCD